MKTIDITALDPWPEQDQEWLNDPKLPIDNVDNMIKYMRKIPSMSWALDTMVISETEMPQSYAHWWCMSRNVYPKKLFDYTTLKKWDQVQREWWNETSGGDSGVIAMFQSWLDLVRLDMRIFEDEGYRKGIPRLTAKQEIIIPNENIEYTNGPTRQQTLQYIIEQGKIIFSERGWTKGLDYWNAYTEHF